MVYDVDYREAVVADDDVAARLSEQGGDSPGAFVIPTTASRITEIRIGLGSVSAAQDAVLGATSGVHIFGGGITLPEGWFAGPTHSETAAAGTAAGYDFNNLQKYKTNIPVKPGGTFQADAFIYGEDLADAHMCLLVVYDGKPGIVIDADHREVDIGAAANTLYTLNARGGATEGDFKPAYRRIVEVNCGVALSGAGADVGFLIMPTYHLSGPGLLHAGNYKFVAHMGYTLGDTDISGPGKSKVLNRYECDIKTKPGNTTIRAQGQNIESILTCSGILGLCYG